MKLETLYNHFAKQKEANWIIIWDNAQRLYQFIKENPIKRVLDLGTGIGCSSAIIALALEEKGENYHIDTIEQFDKCVNLAKIIIPEALQKNITIHKSNIMAWQTEKIPYQSFSIYKELPELDYDLIINDGPAPFLDENSNYIDLPNGTIIKALLENKIKFNTFIAFDGRIMALRLLERYFSDNFYLVKPADNFNVLQRKENEISFRDERLEYMKQVNYF